MGQLAQAVQGKNEAADFPNAKKGSCHKRKEQCLAIRVCPMIEEEEREGNKEKEKKVEYSTLCGKSKKKHLFKPRLKAHLKGAESKEEKTMEKQNLDMDVSWKV